MLQGTITALATPMLESGNLDLYSFTRLIEFQINSGINGLVIAGSTGESASLDNDEKMLLIQQAIKQIKGRVKVIIGVNFCSTNTAVKFVQQLNEVPGIDYLLVTVPAYVKPTQNGLYLHYAAIAKISKIPLILYNVPGRTGCDLADETALKLAQDFSNIVGLKDATGNIARCGYLVKHKPQNFAILSGDDATALAFMLSGGNGVVSVVSNIIPQQLSALTTYALHNKAANDAIDINKRIVCLYSLMGAETNPIPIKWALYKAGLFNTPTLRLPLTTLSEPWQEKVQIVLTTLMNAENYAN